MHMADALVSPAVGGAMWAVSAGAIACCSARLKREMDDAKVPLMGVMGAFVFAAQMINFSIPGTGSSGHLGGGLLLAVLLGPCAAFLTIASVLVVQALFFADGGLLALGCNIFNLGFFPAFVAYPLIYRQFLAGKRGRRRATAAAVLAAVAGLELGAFAVVLETTASGIAALPFTAFTLLMLPIHLAIGLVEGVVTAAVVRFMTRVHPEVVEGVDVGARKGRSSRLRVVAFVLGAVLLLGGIVSWFAASDPDGLEWAIARVTGRQELKPPPGGTHGTLGELQKRMALFPGYSFRTEPAGNVTGGATLPSPGQKTGSDGEKGKAETSLAGIVGGLMTLLLALLAGFLLKKRKPGA